MSAAAKLLRYLSTLTSPFERSSCDRRPLRIPLASQLPRPHRPSTTFNRPVRIFVGSSEPVVLHLQPLPHSRRPLNRAGRSKALHPLAESCSRDNLRTPLRQFSQVLLSPQKFGSDFQGPLSCVGVMKRSSIREIPAGCANAFSDLFGVGRPLALSNTPQPKQKKITHCPQHQIFGSIRWRFVAGHTWTINDRFVNNFRYGETREAFSQQGDSADNQVTFRFVYSPLRYLRTLNRITPVKNFTDDFSWTSGNHSMQYGGNVRLISNVRSSFSNAYDNGITNPSFYIGGGGTISSLVNAFSPIGAGFASAVQNSATALIGRLSQYSALFTFGHDGSVLPPDPCAAATSCKRIRCLRTGRMEGKS